MADLTLADVCHHLRRNYGDRAPSYNTIWKAVTEGRIPAERRGRSWRVADTDLERVRVAMDLPRPRAA